MKKDDLHQGDVPITGAFLSLVKILQSSRSRFIAESNLANDLDRPHPAHWLERCRDLFFNEFAEQFKQAGLLLNEITFSSLMDLNVDHEVRNTVIADLPTTFVFNPWMGQGKGGIRKIESPIDADADGDEEEGTSSDGYETIEYGVNETGSGVGSNPFESNFSSQREAEEAGMAYMRENPEVQSIAVFRLTIVDNTITNDETLASFDRSDLETAAPAPRG